MERLYSIVPNNQGGDIMEEVKEVVKETTQEPEVKGKTFTQDDLNAFMAKAEAKFEKKTAAKLQEIQEAQKLAGMSETDRMSAENKTLKERLALNEQEKLITQFGKELLIKGLPAEFAEYIPVSDADKAKGAVDFLSTYKANIEKPLTERIAELEKLLSNANLRGTAPKAAIGTTAVVKPLPKVF